MLSSKADLYTLLLALSFYLYSCTSCCDREFAKKKQFNCPTCKTVVKRQGLSEKTVDEIITQKEIVVRKRVVKM
jgi:hypothetical protein